MAQREAVSLEDVRIIGAGVALAIAYGIAHDMVSAHLCLEYFTIGHPRLFAADIPALHALAWGVLATWWVGLLLGVLLAVVARLGVRREKLPAKRVIRGMVGLLGVTGVCAALTGMAAYGLAHGGVLVLGGAWPQLIPEDEHADFLTAGVMHLTSYGVALVGGIVLSVRMWRARRKIAASVS